MLASAATAVAGRAASSRQLPLLTTAQQVRELTPDEANRGYPVRLRAVVTYFNPAEADFFVQDRTAGIYINDPTSSTPLKVGQMLEIEGVTEEPDFAPQIGKPRYRVLGQAPLPAPRQVGFDALMSTREDSQWVQFEGVVRDAVRQGNSLALEVSGGGGQVQTHILEAGGLEAGKLIDARVRAVGVCSGIFNSKNQLVGVKLDLPGTRQLRVVESPPADPFSVPVRSLSSVLSFAAQGASQHRVRVRGTLTLRRRRGLFIQDGVQGLYIPGQAQGPAVEKGDRVEVAGFADVGDYTPVLTGAVYRRTGSSTLPPAQPTTAKQALGGAFDTLRVRMDATLRSVGRSGTDRTLLLQDGDVLFEARLDESLATSGWLEALSPGSRLRLTGICSVTVNRNRVPETFVILLAVPGDVVVLSQPSWWTLHRMLALAALLGGLTIAVLAWVAVLRRRVRHQTEVIRRQLLSESELEKRFWYAARATQDTIWDWNLTTHSVWWSEGIRTVFGYAPEQVGPDAQWWYERIHFEDRQRVQQGLDKVVAAGGEQWSAKYRIQRANGSYAHVLDRGYLIYDSAGSPWRMIGATMDITAAKLAEEQLAQEHNLLRTLIDTMPDYISVKDLQGRLLVANRAVAELLGKKSPDDLLGKTDFDCYPEELARSFRVDDEEVITSGEALINREEANVDRQGQVRWILTTKVPLRDGRDRTVGLISVGRNITSRKHAERELERAKNAAEAASRAKGEFLANMSHEIRTPLNGILGMAELALGTGLNPEQREYLEAVKSSADSLLGVINDILDFSKIEAGKLDLSPVEFELHGHLREMIRLLAVPSRLKGLRLGCEIAPDVPRRVVGDPTRLRQVLLNLLGNAVKFTEVGEVALEVYKQAEDEAGLTLHFVVRDTGIGIEAAKQDAIFEAFAQADGSTTRRFGGTGLGLTISSRLAQMMDGRIWAESEAGCGSRFHFTARLQPAAAQRPEAGAAIGAARPAATFPRDTRVPFGGEQPGSRILLVEDNAVNRILVLRLLEKRGYNVEVATNGREALEALRRRRFDLILMDVQMPDMDGLEATAAIRKQERESGEHISIVALTAHALKGDRERCLDGGMDGYVSKPVRTAELFQTIETFLRARPEAGMRLPDTKPGDLPVPAAS